MSKDYTILNKKYVKATNDKDPVYHGLFWKYLDDHYDNPFLSYSDYLKEQLELLKKGKMPIEDYNNFLTKGESKVLGEMHQRDKNRTLLQKINEENPELIEELLIGLKK